MFYYPNPFHNSLNYNYQMIEMQMMSLHDPIAVELLPHVRLVVDRNDNPWMNPVPSREMIDRMANEVMRSWEDESHSFEVGTEQIGGRRFLRALIIALLISELLRRRRFIFPVF